MPRASEEGREADIEFPATYPKSPIEEGDAKRARARSRDLDGKRQFDTKMAFAAWEPWKKTEGGRERTRQSSAFKEAAGGGHCDVWGEDDGSARCGRKGSQAVAHAEEKGSRSSCKIDAIYNVV